MRAFEWDDEDDAFAAAAAWHFDPAEGTGYKSQKPRDLGGYVTAAPAPRESSSTGLLGGGGRRRTTRLPLRRGSNGRARTADATASDAPGWADLEMQSPKSAAGPPASDL